MAEEIKTKRCNCGIMSVEDPQEVAGEVTCAVCGTRLTWSAKVASDGS